MGVFDGLFEKSGAEGWELSRDEFVLALTASLRHAFPDREPSSSEANRYLASLHLADLALARACALGRAAAWDRFVLDHRPVLYRAADALEPGGGARDIADSLYGDLYGMREGETRGSLLLYFHGRSSLSTWLRAVLSQRYVDRIRAQRRTEPLPEDHAVPVPPERRDADPDRARLVPLVEESLRAAIDDLPVKDRLRLRSYHVAGMTLAQIGRLSGESEATVSRHLARIRRELRSAIETRLRTEAHLSTAEVERALELAIEDPGPLDLQQVFNAEGDRKESTRDRSK